MSSKTEDQPQYTIQPFDPGNHDRTAFDCGVIQTDNYLKLTAKKASKADVVRVWVVVDTTKSIIGFYGINMHAVDVKEMPEKYEKIAGNHGQLPAAFIAMIGVDRTQQGNGIGKALVADAVSRIVVVSNEIGTCYIILDVLNDGDPNAVARRKGFYKSLGFDPLPNQPLRFFMPIQTARNQVKRMMTNNAL